MANAVILLCAGISARMRDQVTDKILVPLKGKPVVNYSLEAFATSGTVDEYIIAYRDQVQRIGISQAIENHPIADLNIRWVMGGTERQDSVYNALSKLTDNIDYVFIHDCARPLIDRQSLNILRDRVEKDKAVTLAHKVTDTIKQIDSDNEDLRQLQLTNLDRSKLWAMETPQVFERKLIVDAYQSLKEKKIKATDDTTAVINYGHTISLLESTQPNPKLTIPEDIAMIENFIEDLKLS